jgi:hypothetical protein
MTSRRTAQTGNGCLTMASPDTAQLCELAVHQYGMAPMALYVLGDAARMDFSGSVHKGQS